MTGLTGRLTLIRSEVPTPHRMGIVIFPSFRLDEFGIGIRVRPMSRSCGKSFSTATFHNSFSSTYLFSLTRSLLPSGIPRQRMSRSRTRRHRSSQASPCTLFFYPSQFSCRVSKQAGRDASRSGVFEEKVSDILLGDLIPRAISRRRGLNKGIISFTQRHSVISVEEVLERKRKPDMPGLYMG